MQNKPLLLSSCIVTLLLTSLITLSSFSTTNNFVVSQKILVQSDTIPVSAPDEEEEEEEEVFMIVEEHPRFPGCEGLNITKERKEICAEEKMLEFLFTNLVYPEEAIKNKTEGQVIIQFVVNKEGYLENIKLVKDIGDGCGEAAMKVINSMNDLPKRWRPGKQRGRNIKVKYTLPIKFSL